MRFLDQAKVYIRSDDGGAEAPSGLMRGGRAAEPQPDLAWSEQAAARVFDPVARIATDRLLLRPVRPDDVGAMFRQFANWQVVRMLSAPPWPYTQEDARDFVALVCDRSNPTREATFAILNASVLIGSISVRLRPASDLQRDPGPNIGYWIGESHWGNGYMTEAAGGFVSFIFEACECDAIFSGGFAENAASLRVQAKLGFVTDGETMLFSRPRGEAFRHINTKLTRAAWSGADR